MGSYYVGGGGLVPEGSVAFITNAEFLGRYDWRWVAKNVLDAGKPAAETDVQGTGSRAGLVLQACVVDASDELMTACAIGDRYTVADLFIDPPAHPGGGAALQRIVADLAMGHVLKRRVRAADDQEAEANPAHQAQTYLEMLRRGERIFHAVPGVPEAGVAARASMDPVAGVDPPLVSENTRIFGLLNRKRYW